MKRHEKAKKDPKRLEKTRKDAKRREKTRKDFLIQFVIEVCTAL
jgi:hypothetical protein